MSISVGNNRNHKAVAFLLLPIHIAPAKCLYPLPNQNNLASKYGSDVQCCIATLRFKFADEKIVANQIAFKGRRLPWRLD